MKVAKKKIGQTDYSINIMTQSASTVPLIR